MIEEKSAWWPVLNTKSIICEQYSPTTLGGWINSKVWCCSDDCPKLNFMKIQSKQRDEAMVKRMVERMVCRKTLTRSRWFPCQRQGVACALCHSGHGKQHLLTGILQARICLELQGPPGESSQQDQDANQVKGDVSCKAQVNTWLIGRVCGEKKTCLHIVQMKKREYFYF